MPKEKDLETKGIGAILILEMVGKPPEHMVKTMEGIMKEMESEKGVKIKGKKINEPVLLKDQKEFYTTFAEVEVEVEQIANLAILMFKYMPSNVEVLHPELIALTNNGWTDILSELTRRLHGYEEVARVMKHQNIKMQEKLKELMPEENSGENKKDSKKK